MFTDQLERIGWLLHKVYPTSAWFIRPRHNDEGNADILIISTKHVPPVAVLAYWDMPETVMVTNATFFKIQITINRLDEVADHHQLGLPAPKTYTIEQIRKYLTSSDSLGDAVHYLSESNIEAANEESEDMKRNNEITGVE